MYEALLEAHDDIRGERKSNIFYIDRHGCIQGEKQSYATPTPGLEPKTNDSPIDIEEGSAESLLDEESI